MGLIFNDNNNSSSRAKNNDIYSFLHGKKKNYKYKKNRNKKFIQQHKLLPLTRENHLSLQSLGYKTR